MSTASHHHAADQAAHGLQARFEDSSLIMGDECELLGVKINGVQFWTVGPKVYRIAHQVIDNIGLNSMLDDLRLMPREDQLEGSDGDNIFENGARLCYLSHGVGRNSEDNIHNLREVNHNSVFRHGVVVIGTSFVSRGLTHELVRHAAGTAFSQVSSRYVDAERLGFVIPEIFMQDSEYLLNFVNTCLGSILAYNQVLAKVERDFLMLDGTSKVAARKLARGACREMLPIATGQTLQMTLNADAARHILRMRGSVHAETQIRKWAIELAEICIATWPVLMDNVTIDREALTVSVGEA